RPCGTGRRRASPETARACRRTPGRCCGRRAWELLSLAGPAAAHARRGNVALGDVAQQGRLPKESKELVHVRDSVLRHARRAFRADAPGDAAREESQLLAGEPPDEVDVEREILDPEAERIDEARLPEARPSLDDADRVAVEPVVAVAGDDADHLELAEPADLGRGQSGPTRDAAHALGRHRWRAVDGGKQFAVELEERLNLVTRRCAGAAHDC